MVPWRRHMVSMLLDLLSARRLSCGVCVCGGGDYIILCAVRLQLSTVTLRVTDCTLCPVHLLHRAVRPREMRIITKRSVPPVHTDASQGPVPLIPTDPHRPPHTTLFKLLHWSKCTSSHLLWLTWYSFESCCISSQTVCIPAEVLQFIHNAC